MQSHTNCTTSNRSNARRSKTIHFNTCSRTVHYLGHISPGWVGAGPAPHDGVEASESEHRNIVVSESERAKRGGVIGSATKFENSAAKRSSSSNVDLDVGCSAGAARPYGIMA